MSYVIAAEFLILNFSEDFLIHALTEFSFILVGTIWKRKDTASLHQLGASKPAFREIRLIKLIVRVKVKGFICIKAEDWHALCIANVTGLWGTIMIYMDVNIQG